MGVSVNRGCSKMVCLQWTIPLNLPLKWMIWVYPYFRKPPFLHVINHLGSSQSNAVDHLLNQKNITCQSMVCFPRINLPSGKSLHNYGKSPCLNGKIHYKWSFSIAMLVYQRVFGILLTGSIGVGNLSSNYRHFLQPPTEIRKLGVH